MESNRQKDLRDDRNDIYCETEGLKLMKRWVGPTVADFKCQSKEFVIIRRNFKNCFKLGSKTIKCVLQ